MPITLNITLSTQVFVCSSVLILCAPILAKISACNKNCSDFRSTIIFRNHIFRYIIMVTKPLHLAMSFMCMPLKIKAASVVNLQHLLAMFWYLVRWRKIPTAGWERPLPPRSASRSGIAAFRLIIDHDYGCMQSYLHRIDAVRDEL